MRLKKIKVKLRLDGRIGTIVKVGGFQGIRP